MDLNRNPGITKFARTESKGDQDKWYDKDTDRWFKADNKGYEALSEALVSSLLERSTIETDSSFRFVRYDMACTEIDGHNTVVCSSDNFLLPEQSIITVRDLLKKHDLIDRISGALPSRERLVNLAETVAEITGLQKFPQYLTLLFEIDTLFFNDDRHLNNIAVLKTKSGYDYCPIFDHGAALLSDLMPAPLGSDPYIALSQLKAAPFRLDFNQQVKIMHEEYGWQLNMPVFTEQDILEASQPFLEYYSPRYREYLPDRLIASIMCGQEMLI